MRQLSPMLIFPQEQMKMLLFELTCFPILIFAVSDLVCSSPYPLLKYPPSLYPNLVASPIITSPVPVIYIRSAQRMRVAYFTLFCMMGERLGIMKFLSNSVCHDTALNGSDSTR